MHQTPLTILMETEAAKCYYSRVMTTTIIQKTLRGLITVGAIFALSIAASAFIAFRLSDLNFWTVHTYQVIKELKESMVALQDVECGDRGYLLTGKKDYLETFFMGRNSVFEHIDNVSELTKDNPTQQANVKKLHELAKQKVDFANSTIESNDINNGVELIKLGRGQEIMNNYRKQLDLMIQTESDLLRVRSAQQEQFQAIFNIFTVALSAASALILFWIYKITKTAIEDEKRRVAELDELNVGLRNEIDQRRRVERALKDTTMRLSSSNTDLQQFAYVASHDLQEPLRAVAGFLTLISNKERGKFDEETEGWITHAVEGAHRMRTLINDLLSYARVESRGKAFQKCECDKALKQAKKDLAVVIEETGAIIESVNLPTIIGDEGQIAQVFQNLIGNSIKFRSKEKPIIIISCEQVEDDWRFKLQDNGIGFDNQHAERIFVIFQRLQGRDEYKGTGIGLALCKKIIERHGGKIWATSEKHKGSTFFFTIPVHLGDNNHGNSVD